MSEDTEIGIARALMNAGRALERLNRLMDEDYMNSPSKHDPKFHSEHERESELLYDMRAQFCHITSEISEIYAMLKGYD